MNSCEAPAFNARLGDLCCGEMRDSDGAAVEAHLLVCDACWTEFQRLSEAVHIVRAEGARVQPVVAADLLQLVGLGGRLEKPFAGHRYLSMALAVGFASMMGLAFPVEVAYAWTIYGTRATILGPTIAIVSLTVALAAYWLLAKRTREGDTKATLWAALIPLSWGAVVALALSPLLPNQQIVRAEFQTMTGTIGFLKSTIQALELPLLTFVPYQFIVALQRELRDGRTDRVLRILTNDPMRTTPRGSLFVGPKVAGFVALVYCSWWILGTAHLLENLAPSPFLSLFMALALARSSSAVLTTATLFVWYVRMLDEIKRQAVAIAGGRSRLNVH